MDYVIFKKAYVQLYKHKFFFLFILPIFAQLYWNFISNAIKVESYHVLLEPMNLTTNLKAPAVTFNSKYISNYIIMCSDNPLCYFRAPYIEKRPKISLLGCTKMPQLEV